MTREEYLHDHSLLEELASRREPTPPWVLAVLFKRLLGTFSSPSRDVLRLSEIRRLLLLRARESNWWREATDGTWRMR